MIHLNHVLRIRGRSNIRSDRALHKGQHGTNQLRPGEQIRSNPLKTNDSEVKSCVAGGDGDCALISSQTGHTQASLSRGQDQHTGSTRTKTSRTINSHQSFCICTSAHNTLHSRATMICVLLPHELNKMQQVQLSFRSPLTTTTPRNFEELLFLVPGSIRARLHVASVGEAAELCQTALT